MTDRTEELALYVAAAAAHADTVYGVTLDDLGLTDEDMEWYLREAKLAVNRGEIILASTPENVVDLRAEHYNLDPLPTSF